MKSITFSCSQVRKTIHLNTNTTRMVKGDSLGGVVFPFPGEKLNLKLQTLVTNQRASFYTYHYHFQLLCSYCILTNYYVSLAVSLKPMLAWQFPFSYSFYYVTDISTLEHALLSYLQYKVQIHVYFSIKPLRMKHLFTLSVPKVIFWHCTPWEAETLMAAFVQFVLTLLKIPKSMLCFVR